MSDWNPETTPNFSPAEMACKCGTCGGLHDMRQDFMVRLQAFREAIGRPLTVTSGYRCPKHPEEARKATPGAHGQGQAVDLACNDAGLRHEMVCLAMAQGFPGVGVAKTFIHLDGGHDSARRPALWSY
ncbi:MAG: D-Ala-D-Ala carboxypeptidase family metallohydrolase [Pseudomonadota bacterium]|nr:D-Ala-D-Ala carboxypeptidase family metallohydrolase [Pseudomonadota bacterium]